MPIYVYKCDECGKEREVTLMVVERDKCDGNPCALTINCGGTLKRVVCPTNFRLGKKGKHGWSDNGYADNLLGNDPQWRKDTYGE